MKTAEAHWPEAALLPDSIAEEQRMELGRYGTWRRFHQRLRKSGQPLLAALSRYGNCILVGGCQRSGTTMLTRIVSGARAFQRLALTVDDELDAALILAGKVNVPADRRYCFQTTYLMKPLASIGRLARVKG